MQKPPSIRLFSALFWLGVAINIVAGMVNGPKSMALAGIRPATPAIEFVYIAFGIAMMICIFTALWFLIIRRASGVARWTFTIFALLMLALNVASAHVLVDDLGVLGTALELGRFAVWVVAAMVLFRGDANTYFRQARSSGGIAGD